ncbi:MAG: O-antigen polysaccharide polymerase Wzy [Flavobacteriaceae bacterium]
MIYVSLVCCILLFALFSHRNLILVNPYTVFSISFFYYNFFIPIIFNSLDDATISVSVYKIAVDSETIARVALLNFAAFAGFTLGYRLINPMAETSPETPPSPLAAPFLYSVAIIAVFAVLFFSRQFYQPSVSYSENVYLSLLSVYTFSKTFIYSTISIYSIYKIFHSKKYLRWFAAPIALLFFFAITTYDKNPILFAGFIGMCFLFRIFPNRQKSVLGAMVVLATIFLITFIPAFSIYRQTGVFEFHAPDELNLSTVLGDARGPFGVIAYVLTGYEQFDFPGVFESLFLWIPKFIWAARPDDMAQVFAQSVIPNWQPGQGLGFSPLAEAYIRVGSIFVAPYFLGLGILFAALLRVFSRFFPPDLQIPMLMSGGAAGAFLINRGATSGILTQSLQFWLPMLAILALVSSLTALYRAAGTTNRFRG